MGEPGCGDDDGHQIDKHHFVELKQLGGEGKEKERERFMKGIEGLPVDKFSMIPPHTFGGKVQREDNKGFRTKGDRYVPCTFLWYSMSIRWDGMVVPCCIDLSGEMPVGDVKKESLLDIWNGERLMDIREKIAKGKYRGLPLCSGCDILWKEQVFGIPMKSIKELKYFFNKR